jgi:hypothetical protein
MFDIVHRVRCIWNIRRFGRRICCTHQVYVRSKNPEDRYKELVTVIGLGPSKDHTWVGSIPSNMMTETEPASETSCILQVPKMMDSVQHSVCILLDLFVQIMWRGLQCCARGWEPSPVHWIWKATLLIKCYSRPHSLRTSRPCVKWPTRSSCVWW